MNATPRETTTTTPETPATTAAAAPGIEAEKKAKAKETADILGQAEEMAKEFENTYGKNPTKEDIVARFQQENPAYKDKSYEDIMDILKNGPKKSDGEYDTSLQQKNLHRRLQKNVEKEPRQEIPETPEAEAAPETEAEEPAPVKQVEEVKIEEPKIQETSRRKQEDENARPGSKKTAEAPKEEKKETKEKLETKKRKGGFFKAIGKTIIRPFANVGKIARTIGRTVWTPVGLSSYMLSDIGEKKKTGWHDRWTGYKKIWKGK